MRVLNVGVSNNYGGVQSRILTVARELRNHGIETIILTPKEEGDFLQKASEEDFRVIQTSLLSRPRYLDSFSSIIANLKLFFTFPFSVFVIARLIKNENIDIVHLNGLYNFQVAVAAFITRKKIVWHLISTLYPKLVVRFLMPFVELLADHTVVVAEKIGTYYFGNKDCLKRSNTSIIYSPVNINTFNPKNSSNIRKENFKQEFNIKDYDRIVGFVGSINPAKGLEYFIHGANLIKKSFNNVKFVIVGGVISSQQNYHKRLLSIVESLQIDEDIIFTGKRSIDDLPDIYSLFDIVLLTSVAEGIPLVILEAMSMEKPVIATDVGGISEHVIDGDTGTIVPVRDPKAIAEAVKYYLENPKQRIRVGKRGKKRIEKYASLEKCVKEHKNIYMN